MKPTLTELVEGVKKHARDHYTEGGWDVVVETMDFADIAKIVFEAASVKAAIRRFKPMIEVWADREADAAFHASQA